MSHNFHKNVVLEISIVVYEGQVWGLEEEPVLPH